MPKMELEWNELDGLYVQALSCFPNDAKRRRDFMAVQVASHKLAETRGKGYVEFSAELAEDLLDAPSHSDMKRLITTASKRGLVAGDYLLSIFAMSSFPNHFPEPSNRKAVELAQAFAKQSKFGDGSPMPTSGMTIRKYFAEFNSVAHLWAAMRLHQVFQKRGQREIFRNEKAVKDFLGVAGLLQDFGCSFIPKRAKPRLPILDPKPIWRVPVDAQRLAPPWKDPPEWMLRVVRNYRVQTTGY